MRRHACYLFAGLLILTVSCDRTDTSAEADSVEEVEVRELTPSERVVLHQAEITMSEAFDSASASALRKVELDMRQETDEPPESVASESTTRLTVLFGSNNRGEREDCGCRRNPLGGLARRHTMVDALTDPEQVVEIWGSLPVAQGPVFHVDAGNTLFKSATLGRGTPNAQKIAKHDARAVVAALNTFPPDAMLAGELEWVFGLDQLRALAELAQFPIISANVTTADGEPVFDGSVVVDRDDVKIAVIGITRKETRLGDYWSSRGLAATDPLEAAKRELGGLGDDVDAVVLLSNLGLDDTQELIEGLTDQTDRLGLAVVSGTNRLTSDPEFADGVPVVEPLSRGKYVGRADLFVNGETIEYRNAVGPTATTLRNYRRAMRSYWTTRRQLARHRKQVAQLELRTEKLEAAAEASDGESATQKLDERRKDALESRNKRVETYLSRLETVSTALSEAAAELAPPSKEEGDDWVVSDVVPVKIEFTEEPSTKRVVTRFQKRRPKEKERRMRNK